MTKLHTPTFQSMADAWGAPFVARDQIERFTGGIITQRYISNLDSLGIGIEGRIRVGRKIVYPVKNVLLFLESRTTVPGKGA